MLTAIRESDPSQKDGQGGDEEEQTEGESAAHTGIGEGHLDQGEGGRSLEEEHTRWAGDAK